MSSCYVWVFWLTCTVDVLGMCMICYDVFALLCLIARPMLLLGLFCGHDLLGTCCLHCHDCFGMYGLTWYACYNVACNIYAWMVRMHWFLLDNLMSLVGSFVGWCKREGYGLHLKKARSQVHGIMVDKKGLGTRI